MESPTIEAIEEQLRELPDDKLAVVADFVAYLVERLPKEPRLETMLASEPVLQRDWLRPEEDEAWADL